jgi:trans-aconitate 2-methyltransferase
VSGPVAAMAQPLLNELYLTGSETVIDLGCGSGRVSALIAEQLPEGRLICIDQSSSMLAAAKKQLNTFNNVDFIEAEISSANLGNLKADIVFSSAVFHWIKDHDMLFNNISEMLAPDGRLLAQCGGQGNIASILRASEEVREDLRYRNYFAFFQDPFNFSSPQESEELLGQAGFADVRCWLSDVSVLPEDPRAYLSQVIYELWYRNGEYHRDDGPALIKLDIKRDNGNKVINKAWYDNGQRHRDDGPALIRLDHDDKVINEAWYYEGQRHRDDGPAIVKLDDHGRVIYEAWYHNSELVREKRH